MPNLNGRLARLRKLERILWPVRAASVADPLAAVLAGYPALAAWLDGRGPQPDPHTVDDFIPRRARCVVPALGWAGCADAVERVVTACIVCRAAERGTVITDDESLSAYLDTDAIAATWAHNVALYRAVASEAVALGLGTDRAVQAVSWQGERSWPGNFGAQSPVTDECDAACFYAALERRNDARHVPLPVVR